MRSAILQCKLSRFWEGVEQNKKARESWREWYNKMEKIYENRKFFLSSFDSKLSVFI